MAEEEFDDDDTQVASRDLPDDASINVGRLLAGRYKLVSVLGEGGMGVVYEAEHVDIGKRVAIKVLSKVVEREGEATARFLREARATSAIESEHIVQVFDVGEDLDLGLYMVMELLKGEDLAKHVHARGSFNVDAAAGIVMQLCHALERAHDAGIVHRDLKPENVFLARTDGGGLKVKLVDLGIAKLIKAPIVAETLTDDHKITKRGAAVGTPQYMSPEQAQGLDTVDHRTDIYSLGAVFYEALVGQPPIPEHASYAMTLVEVITKPPPRVAVMVPDIDPRIDALVFTMMASDPAARPPSAVAVREQLAAIFPDLLERSALRVSVRSSLVPASSKPAPAKQAKPRTDSGVTVGLPKDEAEPRATKKSHSRTIAWLALAAALAIGLVARCSATQSTTASATPTSLPSASVSPSPSPSPSPTTTTPPAITSPAATTPPATTPPRPAPSAITPAITTPPATTPPSPTTPSTTTPASARDAQRALERGQIDRAIAIALAATQHDPTDAEAWLTLGAAYETQGRKDAALAAYKSCTTQGTGPRVGECRALLHP
ncbi:MAG: serine/threonine protein kinase [Myxococcaceae bacterium]|nr:serine/threonine protein kinase [Myxococcaceae bacterium]